MATVKGMEFVPAIPPDDQRDPEILYIVEVGIEERDRVLGSLMGVWSEIESVLCGALRYLLNSDYETALTISSAVTQAELREIIDGLAQDVLDDQQFETLSKLMDRTKTLASQRNRIVHALWENEVEIGNDEKDRPVVTKFEWVRVYVPTSPAERAALRDPKDQKQRAKYRFTLKSIFEAAKQMRQHRITLDSFLSGLPKRQPPPPALP